MTDEKFPQRRFSNAPPSRAAGASPEQLRRRAATPARTIIGLPMAQPDFTATHAGTPRPGLSGSAPGADAPLTDEAGRAAGRPTARGLAPEPVDEPPDRRYMDPPSEAFARSHAIEPELHPPAQAQPTSTPAARTPLRPSPYAATNPEPLRRGPLSAHPRSTRPSASPYSATAPAEWRAAARTMAERQKTFSSSPGTTASPKPPDPAQADLRLKLDLGTDAYEEPYRGVPKSRLPTVMFLCGLLLAVVGGTALWAQSHGGLAGVLARLHLGSHGVVPEDETATPAAAPTQAPLAQPSAAPGSGAPTTTANAAQAPSAAPAAAEPQPGAKPAKPDAVDQTQQARALADPEAPTQAAAEPARHQPAQPATRRHKPAHKRVHVSKPAAKPAAHHRSHPSSAPADDPVLKIRDLGQPAPPPEPTDTPYAPPAFEPPTPDEPR